MLPVLFYIGIQCKDSATLNELGKDVNIPKAALKLLLDVLLPPDLQEQLSFCIAPCASVFRHLFSHTRALDYVIAQSRCGIQIQSTFEIRSDNLDSIGIESQLNPDSPAHVNGTIRIQSAL